MTIFSYSFDSDEQSEVIPLRERYAEITERLSAARGADSQARLRALKALPADVEWLLERAAQVIEVINDDYTLHIDVVGDNYTRATGKYINAHAVAVALGEEFPQYAPVVR